MADKMDVDAVNGDKKEEKVGPAPDLPAERSTYTIHQTLAARLDLLTTFGQSSQTTSTLSTRPSTPSMHASLSVPYAASPPSEKPPTSLKHSPSGSVQPSLNRRTMRGEY